jgi:hypothetical protein
MTVSFQLTMPNVGSWNGRWTGASKQYFVIRKYLKNVSYRDGIKSGRILELLGGEDRAGWYYNFGDGWGASVTMEIVDAKEANKRRKASSGFCGYEWMIDSILKHGEILSKEPETIEQ